MRTQQVEITASYIIDHLYYHDEQVNYAAMQALDYIKNYLMTENVNLHSDPDTGDKVLSGDCEFTITLKANKTMNIKCSIGDFNTIISDKEYDMSTVNRNQNLSEIVKDINVSAASGFSEWAAEDCAADHAINAIYDSGQTVCYQTASEVLNNLYSNGALFNIDVAIQKLLDIPFMSE